MRKRQHRMRARRLFYSRQVSVDTELTEEEMADLEESMRWHHERMMKAGTEEILTDGVFAVEGVMYRRVL